MLLFTEWLLAEGTIPITQDMFVFANEVLDKLEELMFKKSPWKPFSKSFRFYRVFYSRVVDFGEYGKREVLVRAVPIAGYDQTAKVDDNMMTVYLNYSTGFHSLTKRILAHELIHIIDPGFKNRLGREEAAKSISKLNAMSQAGGKPGDIYTGYANQRHELAANTGGDAYGFMDDLYNKPSMNPAGAKKAIQQQLTSIRTGDPAKTGEISSYYGKDRRKWKKYARGYADAYDDYFGALARPLDV